MPARAEAARPTQSHPSQSEPSMESEIDEIQILPGPPKKQDSGTDGTIRVRRRGAIVSFLALIALFRSLICALFRARLVLRSPSSTFLFGLLPPLPPSRRIPWPLLPLHPPRLTLLNSSYVGSRCGLTSPRRVSIVSENFGLRARHPTRTRSLFFVADCGSRTRIRLVAASSSVVGVKICFLSFVVSSCFCVNKIRSFCFS